jgi:threonine/homoserine/homoserine lactone efflux protein
MVHVGYIMLGLGFIIAKTTWLFNLFKYIGAAYLFYIGYKGITAKKLLRDVDNLDHLQDILPLAAVRAGFLTNALNPKAMLFFLSMFSIVVAPATPVFIMGIYSIIIFSTTLLWFGFVALCLSGQKIRGIFREYCHWIERVTGFLLILIAIRLTLH